jgi:hypothetical protein
MTSRQKKFKTASATCRRRRVKPFTKAFGACMRGQLKGRGRKKRRR